MNTIKAKIQVFFYKQGKKINELKTKWKEKVRKYKFVITQMKEVINSAFGAVYNHVSEDKEFLYTREFHQNENYMSVNLRMLAPKGKFGDEFSYGNPKPSHQIYEDFGRIRGLEKCYSMSFEKYQISFLKAEAFTWEELWPYILKVMEKHLSNGLVSREMAEPKRPDPEQMRRDRMMAMHDDDRF